MARKPDTRQPDWRIVTDIRDKLGESPQWNSATGELFWIDFYGPTIHRLSAKGARKDWVLKQFCSIGSVVPCEDGRLVIGVDTGLFFFDPADGSTTPFADPNHGRPDLPYNDAKVDRHGNYWIGNFEANEAAPRGMFYVYNRRGKWRIGDSGFIVCNGPTFSPKGDVLYFSDSLGRQSLAYDLAPDGKLTKRRVFQKYDEADGLPDGCCVDVEGCVWIAFYDGSKVMRLSPGGERLETLTLPARFITSCCLGGKDLRTLYVTSGQAPDGSPDPEGGALFATEVEVPGLPEPLFRPV